jgi:tetratricopeptide (TPR) repeat protein
MYRLLAAGFLPAALFFAQTSNDVVARSNLGVQLARQGRFDEAIAEYKKALALDPENASIELNLGLAYYKSGRIPEAARDFSRAREAAPDNLQITLLLADCQLRMGQNANVIALLQPAEQQNPNDLAIAYLLGTALIRDNRVQEGQRRVDRILRNGDSPEARFLLGNQMFVAGDYPAAMKQFARAIELNPSLPGLQSFYGQALLYTGDPDGAAEAFRKELASDPNDFEANVHLAEILTARGKRSEAEPLIARARRVRPDYVEAKPATAIQKISPASVFTVRQMDSGKPVTLRAGPMLLVFGSYTCPNFRAAAPTLNKLYSGYKRQLPFYLIYIREAHSTADWQSTRNERESIVLPPAATMDEQHQHASMCVRKLHIDFPALLDGLDGAAEKAYSAWPSKAVLVNREGQIVFSTGLNELDFKPDQLEAAIRNLSNDVH